ncbi:MAG: hypothetical protein R6U67_18665 [Sodalinema sp.]|uniref:hypothetical protein n=1 Tax=Sodalinema sp. TaxID=3080550 RepID=UPI00120F83B4|nr:MAG: hypothetical protein EYR95_02480 [Phormidium sp. SL48-SHIP]
MPLQHLPNSIHRVRAKLRTLTNPSIWLSILGVVLILGVAWEYVDRHGVRKLAEEFSLDALNGSDNDDASNWEGEVSGEEARVAADIDSSDVLQQIISQQGTPSPLPTENPNADRQENIDRILEILANPEPDLSSESNNGNSDESQETASAQSNPFLQGLGLEESDDEASSSQGSSPERANNGFFNGFFAPNQPEEGTAAAPSSPQLTPLEMGFQQLANPRTGSLGLMQPLSESPEEASEFEQQQRAAAEGRAEETSEAESADGRATSADTLPAFAMPVPPAAGQFSPSDSDVSTFTGYPYNPNAVTGATPQTGAGTPSGSSAGDFNPGISGNPSNGYRRPTYGNPASPQTGMQNGSLGNPGAIGGYDANPSANPYQETPGDVLNPNGAVFRGPVPDTGTGYPDGSMNATPESQESLRNQPPEPFSVPRTPPGRAIGGGRINTFANP